MLVIYHPSGIGALPHLLLDVFYLCSNKGKFLGRTELAKLAIDVDKTKPKRRLHSRPMCFSLGGLF